MMKTLYAIYSNRGIHIEKTWGDKKQTGEKRVVLYGKARAEETAQKLTKAYKRRYWSSCVEVKEV